MPKISIPFRRLITEAPAAGSSKIGGKASPSDSAEGSDGVLSEDEGAPGSATFTEAAPIDPFLRVIFMLSSHWGQITARPRVNTPHTKPMSRADQARKWTPAGYFHGLSFYL